MNPLLLTAELFTTHLH